MFAEILYSSDSSLKEREKMSLEITNLTKSYDGVLALCEVDLYVQPGEVVGVLGPNGAGKSTLLRLCEGVETLDTGRICCFGKDLSVEKNAIKGNLGLVLQRPTFSAYSTVREVIQLFSDLNATKFEPMKLANVLGLDEKLDAKIAKLSGGQRQRLAVLIGLMWGAGLILLDEPTSELDPHARRIVWDLISQVAKQANSAVLMTTHQMEEAEALCDRVYILEHGKVVTSGTPSQIIYEHCDEITLTVSIAESLLFQTQELLGELEYSKHGHILKCQKIVKSLEDGQELIKLLLQQDNFEVLDIGLERSNLEDVFIRLTGNSLKDSVQV
jgi:ABC-2 type transport system ATP-binding protein